MNVLVKNLDDTEINPIFDPIGKEEVVGFYQKLLWQSAIRGYKVTFDDGTGFSTGCYGEEAF